MEILLSVAELQGAEKFLDVFQAHIDACIYTGPAGLDFAQKLLSVSAKFTVPTTLNSISIDKCRWKEIGMDSGLVSQAEKLAEDYLSMGAAISFTCAPYLLDTAPKAGENTVWAEQRRSICQECSWGSNAEEPRFSRCLHCIDGTSPISGMSS